MRAVDGRPAGVDADPRGSRGSSARTAPVSVSWMRTSRMGAKRLRVRPAAAARPGQPSSRSSWAASDSSSGSLSGGPTSWAPIGRPRSLGAAGTDDRRLAGHVPEPGEADRRAPPEQGAQRAEPLPLRGVHRRAAPPPGSAARRGRANSSPRRAAWSASSRRARSAARRASAARCARSRGCAAAGARAARRAGVLARSRAGSAASARPTARRSRDRARRTSWPSPRRRRRVSSTARAHRRRHAAPAGAALQREGDPQPARRPARPTSA